MKLEIPKAKTFLLLIFFAIALIASRTINLNKTARFIWDESSDLVNIHEIYVDKKLTLIGPISEDGSKVFGSLTYYMYLPFAVAGNFDPISTAYGAAFWGIITGLLLLYLVYKVNKKLVWLFAPIIILWYPLVETGRWAWNPNLIPFWVILALIFYLGKGNFSKFLSGLFVGLSVHHHYLAIFAAAGLGLVIIKDCLESKKWKSIFSYAGGVILALAPFVLFDLTHPPGLFLSRILYFNNLGPKIGFLDNLFSVVNGTFLYFVQIPLIAIIFAIIILFLILIDIKTRSKAIYFFLAFIVQLVGVAFASNFYPHYILAGIPFLVVYLIYPRKNYGAKITFATMFILLISSIITFPAQITKVIWESDISSTRFIANTIRQEITFSDLKNNNIAVLASPDTNTYGRRYRDLLLIKNTPLLNKGQYEISDHLFVVTTSNLETVREDPAYEIKDFKDGPLIKSWNVPGSDWKVFLLARS